MPISLEEFNLGERSSRPEDPGQRKQKTKLVPTGVITKKTVHFKGPIKKYGQYDQQKFYVKFTEGPDDKAMFHEEHWNKFRGGDEIEFESKFNPETQWHGIHKRHYVKVIEREGDMEVEVVVGDVVNDNGQLTTILDNPTLEGVKVIIFAEDLHVIGNTKYQIFGKKVKEKLYAETIVES